MHCSQSKGVAHHTCRHTRAAAAAATAAAAAAAATAATAADLERLCHT